MKKKQFLAMLLSAAMVFTVGAPVYAADKDITVSEASEQVVGAEDRKASGDIAMEFYTAGSFALTGDSYIAWSPGVNWGTTVTMDLAGHTLDCRNNSIGTQDRAILKIYDSVGGGKVINLGGFQTQGSGSVTIYGGTYDADITEYVDENAKIKKNSDGTITVGNAGTNPNPTKTPTSGPEPTGTPTKTPTKTPTPTPPPIFVYAATIEGTAYRSLQSAVEAAKNGDEISVIRDLDLSRVGLTVAEGKDVVINTDGNTVKFANTAAGQISVNGNLTIRDETGRGSIAYTGSNGKSSFGMVEVADGGKLILESGAKIDAAEGGFNVVPVLLDANATFVSEDGAEVTAVASAVKSFDSVAEGSKAGPAEITINGGKFVSTGADALEVGRNLIGGSTVEINGGEFIGSSHAVEMADGTMTINDGTFAYTGEYNSFVQLKGEDSHLFVNGGTFVDGPESIEDNIYVLYDEDSTVSVAAGTFALEVPEEQLAEGAVCEENEDGTWTVTGGTVVKPTVKPTEAPATPTPKPATPTPEPTIVVEPTKAPSDLTASFYGLNLSLEGKIGAYVYFRVPAELAEDEGAYAIIEMEDDKAEKVLLDENTKVSEDSKGVVYGFAKNVTAAQTNNEINVKLYTSDDEAVTLLQNKKKLEDGYTFSVAGVAATYQNSSVYTAKTRDLAKAIKNYGIYAQKLMDYKADGYTPDDKLSDVTLSSLKSYAPKTSGSVKGVKYVGNNLSLKSETELFVYFQLSKDVDNYTFTIDGEEVEAVDTGDGIYAVRLGNIAAQKLSEIKEFAVTDGNSTFTAKLGALSWSYSTISNKASKTESVNMAKMVYRYSQKADAYFKS